MKICKKCSSVEFYKDGNCKSCARERVKKRWAENPDKMREQKANWLSKRPGYFTEWNKKNPEKKAVKDAKWRSENREKARYLTARWESENKESKRIHCQNRRVRKLDNGGALSKGLSEKLFALQRGMCACGCKQPLGDDYHLDHIMPLALGGSNTDDNIQLLKPICNKKKHAKDPIDFMRERGFLL